MSQRETSVDCYRQIEAEGLLSARRWRVYSALFQHQKSAGITAGELWVKMRKDGGSRMQKPEVCARLTELRHAGCIEEHPSRQCTYSGREVIVWATNGKLPEKGPFEYYLLWAILKKDRVWFKRGLYVSAKNILTAKAQTLVEAENLSDISKALLLRCWIADDESDGWEEILSLEQ